MADRWASVGTLAAGAAHEINNPLTIVYTNLEYLSRSAALADVSADPERRRRLEVALAQCREGAERVRQIVRNLLTFARADHEGRVPVFVEEVLESAAGLCSNDLKLRAQIVRDFHPVPPVEANPARLAQVFLNLLLNALHAIPEGSPDDNAVTLSVGLNSDGQIEVIVRDTGVGIPSQVLDHIFDPFFTTRSPGEGSGLGLFVCQNLVTEIGGEIAVERPTGRGTVFRVRLPPLRPEALRPPPAPSVQPRRARVLLIDDETNLRTSLAQLLSVEHAVTSLGSAREAIDLLAQGRRFNIILCDLMMPGVSGIDFYEYLQREAPDQLPRVIFLSGGAFTSRAQAFLDRVPNPHVEKPFELDVLREVIQRTLATTPSALPPA